MQGGVINIRKAPRFRATKAEANRKETTMTTIMNNNASVNDWNYAKDPANTQNGIENGVCTIKCVASTNSIDASGDYRITRRLECTWTNQGINTGDKILDLEIAGTKGTTPVVTLNGQVVPSKSMALDPNGNLEVRCSKGMLLDIVKLPDEYSMSTTSLEMPKTESVVPVAKPFLGIAVRPASGDLAHNLPIDPRNVCVVSEVVPGSPAFTAGLEPNDVILGINGKQANLSNLRHELSTAKVGQSIPVIFLCKGVKREASVKIGNFGWVNKKTPVTTGFGGDGNDYGIPCPFTVGSNVGIESTWMSSGALI